MSKLALVFPGQGSQEMGMGQKYYNEFTSAKQVFELASDVMGIDSQKLCFETSIETLSETIHSQPAIFTVSMAMTSILKEKGIAYDGVCGFSLGEICALVAGGVYSLENGFTVISKRAKAMQDAAQSSSGGMAAIIGLEDDVVESICKSINGYVECVNYNCPKQIVIAGEEAALASAMEECKNLKAMKVVKLAVNAAFHSNLMTTASENFYRQISPIKTTLPTHDIYTNTTANKLEKNADIAAYLKKQMTSPVLFTKSIQKMIEDGYTKFVEMGNGKILSGLIKRISRGVQILSLDELLG